MNESNNRRDVRVVCWDLDPRLVYEELVRGKPPVSFGPGVGEEKTTGVIQGIWMVQDGPEGKREVVVSVDFQDHVDPFESNATTGPMNSLLAFPEIQASSEAFQIKALRVWYQKSTLHPAGYWIRY